MKADVNIPLLALAGVVVLMAAELRLSQRNERRMREAGAIEPAGDVYPWLRIAYPASFVAMAIEGTLRHPVGGGGGTPPGSVVPVTVIIGIFVFAVAKALKAWAIASLGMCWSFRVLVRPHRPLIGSGPYRYLRHPNYVAIAGELVGMALLVGAPVTGVVSLVAIGLLLHRRIEVEERALGLRA